MSWRKMLEVKIKTKYNILINKLNMYSRRISRNAEVKLLIQLGSLFLTKIQKYYKDCLLVILFLIVLVIHIKFVNIVYNDSLAHIAMQEINENNLKLLNIKGTIMLDQKIYFISYEAYANYRQQGGSISDIRPEFNLKNRKLTYLEEYLLSFGYISNVEDRNSIEFCSNKTEYKTIDDVNNMAQKLKEKTINSDKGYPYKFYILLGLGFLAGIGFIALYCYTLNNNYILDIKENFPNIREITENTSNDRIYIPNKDLPAFYVENNRPSTALEEYWGRLRFDVYLDRSNFQCFVENFKPKGLAEKFNIAPHTSFFNLMATRPDDLLPIRILDDLKKDVQIPLHFNILNNLFYIDKQDLKKPNMNIPINAIIKNLNFYQTVAHYKIQPFFYHYRAFLEYLVNIPKDIYTHTRNSGPTLNDPGLMAKLFQPRSKK